MKSKIFLIIKWSISLLLLFWLLKKGALSMRNVELAFSNLQLVTVFLLITFCQLYLGAVRTHFLMQFHSRDSFTLKRVLSITWASSFINCIAPSALFGEAFKVKELLTVDPKLNKDNTFYALVLSKLFSIFSLVVITVVGSLLVKHHPRGIRWLLDFLYVSVILTFFLYFIRNLIISALRPLLRKMYRLSTSMIWRQRFDNYRQYHTTFLEEKKNLIGVMLLSLSLQILNTGSFLLIIYAINPSLDQHVLEIAYVIPLGIIAMTLPISVSGLGVGHLAFSQLLGIFGIMTGADIFTIYFAYSYIFNLIGIIPFIFIYTKR